VKKDYKRVLRSEEFIFTAVLFAVILVFTIQSVGWPFKAGIFPLAVCAGVLVLLAGQLANIFLKAGEESTAKEGVSKGIPWKVMVGFLILGATTGIAYVFGLHFAAGFLGASLCWLYGERRWWVILLMAIGSFSLMYFLYGQVFRIPMQF